MKWVWRNGTCLLATVTHLLVKPLDEFRIHLSELEWQQLEVAVLLEAKEFDRAVRSEFDGEIPSVHQELKKQAAGACGKDLASAAPNRSDFFAFAMLGFRTC